MSQTKQSGFGAVVSPPSTTNWTSVNPKNMNTNENTRENDSVHSFNFDQSDSKHTSYYDAGGTGTFNNTFQILSKPNTRPSKKGSLVPLSSVTLRSQKKNLTD